MITGLAIFFVTFAIGMAAAVRRAREEFEPDERPANRALLTRVLRRNPHLPVIVVLFVVVLAIEDSAGVVAAVLASAALVSAAVVGTVAAMRNHGIEREHLLVATALAFVATSATCAVWSTFEVFADAPLISMRVPWVVGLVVMLGALAVQRRRAA